MRLGGWPRRLLALGFLLLAALSALHHSPTAGTSSASVPVVTAAHDLVAGAVLATADVRVSEWPAALRPASAITSAKNAIGRRVVSAVGTGEVITLTRVVGSELTTGLPRGLIAVPIPLVDSGAAGLIRAGDHVDLLSPPDDSSKAAVMVASAVLVLAVIAPASGINASNAQLVVAVDQPTELRIAQAITTPLFATLINSP
jgi:Flp pilus assembly protein CpaB